MTGRGLTTVIAWTARAHAWTPLLAVYLRSGATAYRLADAISPVAPAATGLPGSQTERSWVAGLLYYGLLASVTVNAGSLDIEVKDVEDVGKVAHSEFDSAAYGSVIGVNPSPAKARPTWVRC